LNTPRKACEYNVNTRNLTKLEGIQSYYLNTPRKAREYNVNTRNLTKLEGIYHTT
jgi:hypothetical protein